MNHGVPRFGKHTDLLYIFPRHAMHPDGIGIQSNLPPSPVFVFTLNASECLFRDLKGDPHAVIFYRPIACRYALMVLGAILAFTNSSVSSLIATLNHLPFGMNGGKSRFIRTAPDAPINVYRCLKIIVYLSSLSFSKK